MDELYVESFSSKERDLQVLEKPKNAPIIENNVIEIYEFNHQMHLYLERLQEEIIKDYGNFSDYRFAFERIKKQLQEKNIKALPKLLADLEDLLDVDFPLIALQKKLGANLNEA